MLKKKNFVELTAYVHVRQGTITAEFKTVLFRLAEDQPSRSENKQCKTLLNI